MQPIDQKYKKKRKLKYFRYVDDILILCDYKRINNIRKKIDSDFLKLGLRLHTGDSEKCKSCEVTKEFGYLGYTFKNQTISIRDKSIDKFRESIIKILTGYKYSNYNDLKLLEWGLNLRISGCIFNGTRYGWLFFFSQTNDVHLLFFN